VDAQELRAQLHHLASALAEEDRRLLEARLNGLISVYPFNEYEYILTFLMDRGSLTFNQYEDIRRNYVATNRYLNLFGLSPRVFGQVWGEKHLMDMDARFQKPSTALDPRYEGQYDLWLESIRVEVKAARAIHTRERGDILAKALNYGANKPFWMNYQQLKFDVCDAFVFIGVWVDRIVYWVMTTEEAKDNEYLSHQHRGGVEYQIGVRPDNISRFDEYLVEPASLASTIIAKVQRKRFVT